MTSTFRLALTLTALLALTWPAAAQQAPDNGTPTAAAAAHPATPAPDSGPAADAAAAAESACKKGRPLVIQYYRPQDKRGINMFETTKDPGAEFKGFKLDVG